MEPDKVEQITKEKGKDPKKVAAGRKLAESNKKAREALKREVDHESRGSAEVDPKSESWIPNIDFQTVLSIVGIAITLFGLFREVSRVKATRRSHNPNSHSNSSNQK